LVFFLGRRRPGNEGGGSQNRELKKAEKIDHGRISSSNFNCQNGTPLIIIVHCISIGRTPTVIKNQSPTPQI
jgi:hypothetical protein